jgi:hypothetical protein
MINPSRNPGPTVYRLAVARRYSEIPQAIQERPQDCLWKNDYCLTALHELCQASCTTTTTSTDDGDVAHEEENNSNSITIIASSHTTSFLLKTVDTILELYPHLVAQPNIASWTPLHMACKDLNTSSSSTTITTTWKEQLVLKLIRAYPEAVNCQLQKGLLSKTPFHLVCEVNGSSKILQEMLQISPQLAILPYVQMSKKSTYEYPLFILWRAINNNKNNQDTTNPANDWPKMELLLQAAVTYCYYEQNWSNKEQSLYELATSNSMRSSRNFDNDYDDNNFDVLRACCQINPCPREYISYIVQRYSNRLSWNDSCRGWLPLHYAIQSTKVESPSHTEFLVESILQRYPAAASIPFPISNTFNTATIGNDCQGIQKQQQQQQQQQLLPLHVLILDKKMTWHNGGIKSVVFAYPDALRIPDPRNGLVPALESAIHAPSSRLHLSTTYELLRKSPDVLKTYQPSQKPIVNTGW